MWKRLSWEAAKWLRWLRWPCRRHWVYMCGQLVAIGLCVWWLPDAHLPWTGVAVAIIAVMAAMMSVHPRIRPVDKFVYLMVIALLLFVEFRAMYKDRKEAQEAQNLFQSNEEGRLGKLLEDERRNTKELLEQENRGLSTILSQDQNQFTKTMSTVLVAHGQDERGFAAVVKEEERLIETQLDLSEQFTGRLVPGTLPTPHNGCLRDGQDPEDGQILIAFGDNADIEEKFPHTVLELGDFPVISVDRVASSNAIALTLDFRDSQNHILFRVDKNGVVDRSQGLILLHPNKSTFLVQDSYGVEILRATYINPKVFEVKGKAIYCGRLFDMQTPYIHHSCSAMSGKAGYHFSAPTCPVPQM